MAPPENIENSGRDRGLQENSAAATGLKKGTEGILPRSRRGVHEFILQWFDNQERGRVLDAPAGYGHLSKALKEKGFDVTAAEIEPGIFAVPSIKCVFADLDERIDSDDHSYDYVCCVDGLEHATNPYRAVEELARVLKPGGHAVFSIPNYASVERRLKFLVKGYFTRPVSSERFTSEGGKLHNFHNSVLTITIVEFMMRINGLEIVEIRKNDTKPRQYLFLPLVLWLWLVNLFKSASRRERDRTDLTLNRDVILGGPNLIIIARKSAKQ